MGKAANLFMIFILSFALAMAGCKSSTSGAQQDLGAAELTGKAVSGMAVTCTDGLENEEALALSPDDYDVNPPADTVLDPTNLAAHPDTTGFFEEDYSIQAGNGADCCPGLYIKFTGTSYICWECPNGYDAANKKCSEGTACTSDCTNKNCGDDDGCGGSCVSAPCSTNFGTCYAEGVKTCLNGVYSSCTVDDPRTANCAGKECGSDGCGGECGTCREGKVCNANGLCVAPSAQPSCIDTDGGNNPNVKGTASGTSLSGTAAEYTDKCIAAKDYFSADALRDSVNSLPPDDIGVAEGYCCIVEKKQCTDGQYCEGNLCVTCTPEGFYNKIVETGVAEGTHLLPGPNWFKCEHGCQDGACLAAPPPSSFAFKTTPTTINAGDSGKIILDIPAGGVYKTAYVFKGSKQQGTIALCTEQGKCMETGKAGFEAAFQIPARWTNGEYTVYVYDYASSSWKNIKFEVAGGMAAEPAKIEITPTGVAKNGLMNFKITSGPDGVYTKAVILKDNKRVEIFNLCSDRTCYDVWEEKDFPVIWEAGSYAFYVYDFTEKDGKATGWKMTNFQISE